MKLTKSELLTIPFHLRLLCMALDDWEMTAAEQESITDRNCGKESTRMVFHVPLIAEAKNHCSRIELMRVKVADAEERATKRLNNEDPPEYRCEDIVSGFRQQEVRT